VQVPGFAWHPDGGASQVTPMQGSLLQSPEAALQPKGHGVSVSVKEHAPVVHTPPDEVRDAEPTQIGSGGVQTMLGPLHWPLPSHASGLVQASPSAQAAPAASGS